MQQAGLQVAVDARTQAGLGAPAVQRRDFGAQRHSGEGVRIAQLVGGDAVQLHALVELVGLAADLQGCA